MPTSRVPYVKREELDLEGQASWDKIAAGRGKVFPNYQQMLNSPELAARVCAVGDYILHNAKIPNDDRQLSVLTIARELNCQYEWSVHEPMAAAAGVRPQAIEAVRHRRYEMLTPREQLFAACSREILQNNVTDATWNALENILGRQALVDFVIHAGFYAMICYCMDAFKIDLNPGMQPLLPIH